MTVLIQTPCGIIICEMDRNQYIEQRKIGTPRQHGGKYPGPMKAVILTACSAGMCVPHLPQIVQKANELKIPTAAMLKGAEDLVVLTISASPQEQGKNVADMARKVLGGMKPRDIPPRDPEQIDIIVNLKLAKSMGLVVPADLISEATRLIE